MLTPEQVSTITIWVSPLISLLIAVVAFATARINSDKLDKIHVDVNSRLSELISANSRAERAEGTVAATLSASEIQAMISDGIRQAAQIPPTIDNATLAQVVATRPAVVAVELKPEDVK